MKKGIWLSLLAVVLVGVIAFAIWYINETGEMRAGTKDSFIPYNSALVININANACLNPGLEKAFAADIEAYRKRFLSRVVDTLTVRGYVSNTSKALAIRVEGKNDVSLLYAMDNKDVLSRGEMTDFLMQAFGGDEKQTRKYDRHKICFLKRGKENVYFSVCGGILLISDSDLYIEDGLKQFDSEAAGISPQRYQNLGKYFSAGAGINVFMNSGAFTNLLPLVVNTHKIIPGMDVSQWFKWGALDGEFSAQGIYLNGFMHYAGLDASYIKTFEGQQPGEPRIDAIIPVGASSFGLFNLSNTDSYFKALEAYRYNVGLKDKIFGRRQQFDRMFGKGREEEIKKLLQGEFAVVSMGFDASKEEREGVVIALLKSGSLCKALLDEMLKVYAHFDGKSKEDFRRTFSIDREKSFDYFAFPAEDWMTIVCGEMFGGIRNRYVLIEDNYLVMASSENAARVFIRDYVHGSFIRDAEWYQNLRTRLSGKYNLAWFSQTEPMIPYYQYITEGYGREYVSKNKENLTVFPTLALQWSNESNMLYSTLFLSTDKVKDNIRAHMLWQTKLDARVSMKPVPVVNHETGEKELLVQDDNHTLYLINDAGRVLWKRPLDGKINSEIYQVDLFKNNKLQYLFSTPARMYLIDRNGEPVGRFPVTFRAACRQGITLFDYDNKKDYRIFAPCSDREVYLYDIEGTLIKDWNSRKADKEIVSKVQYFRVDGKDYLVFADRYRLYILDRRGKERVQVSSVFDLRENTNIHLIRKSGKTMLAFANITGPVNMVDFNGQVQTVKCGNYTEKYHMNVADVNGDGISDYVFTDAGKLSVYSLSGQLLYEKEFEVNDLDYPYIYRFSGSDMRIGLLNREHNRMMLLAPDGTESKGFPITGDSPFSIVFSGSDGFFLFAGADNGTVIKYKVQR